MILKISAMILLITIVLAGGCTENQSSAEFAEEVNNSQEYYDSLVVSEPENPEAWYFRGMYYNDAFGQYEKALESYNQSLELDPEYGPAWHAKGISLMNLWMENRSDSHYDNEAEICFANAIQYDPELVIHIPERYRKSIISG